MNIRECTEQLMRKLTLDEKIGMIHGAQLFQTKGVERLGIPPLKLMDGPMGMRILPVSCRRRFIKNWKIVLLIVSVNLEKKILTVIKKVYW